MELVTLAHATLNRIGSASTAGFVRQKEVYRVKEVPDESTNSLRELVLLIAEENGEAREYLQTLREENAWDYTQQRGAVVFNIQRGNVSYSSPYAICCAYPALKIGKRYFKLEEVRI